MAETRTDVIVAQSALRLLLRLAHLVCLLGQVVDEFLGRDGNGKGGVGGAGVDVFVGVDNLFDARDWRLQLAKSFAGDWRRRTRQGDGARDAPGPWDGVVVVRHLLCGVDSIWIGYWRGRWRIA